MVPADSRKISRVPRYSGAKQEDLKFRVHDYHVLWCIFPNASAISLLPKVWSHDPSRASPTGLGCSAFARRYLRNHCCFLFLQVLRWFTSLSLLLTSYFIQMRVYRFTYSEINGSSNECFSPLLIAACHVLLRLKVPRHSPYALSSLTIKFV